MMTLVIPKREYYDEDKELFVTIDGGSLQIEHSLISVSKWESIWHIPFSTSIKNATSEQVISYIKCMTVTQNPNEKLYEMITPEELSKVNEYINDSMTATWFKNTNPRKNSGGTGEIVTSELIYYWMIDLGIPIEICQKWHLNRLLTLIRVCQEKNSGGKKMSQKDVLQQNAMLNKARRKKFGH